MPIGIPRPAAPDPMTDLKRRITELEGIVSRLINAPSLENATIGQGGVRLINGGAITVVDSDGHIVGIIGALPSAYNRADGSAQPGLALWREDGSPAAVLGDLNPTVPPYKQAWQITDRNGTVIMADDTNGGVGLAKPYIPAGTFCDLTPPAATTTSATFAAMQWADVFQQHPKLTASVLVQSSAATTGEVRMTLNGVQIGAVLSIAAATFSQFTIAAAAWPAGSYAFEQRVTVQLEARRLTGTGTIGARSLGLWGVQS